MEELRNIVAMVTSFEETEEYDPKNPPPVDFQQARSLARHLIDNGADALVVSGTTGSSATLSDAGKLALFSGVASEIGPERVICGTGSNDTAHVINLTAEAIRRGLRQFLVVTPYYNKTSQDGLYAHYAAILGRFPDAEFIFYAVEGRTKQKTEPETVAKLAVAFPNLVGIKDADGIEHAEQVWALVKDARPNFRIWSGNDGDTYRMMLGWDPMGRGCGYGVISVDGHLFARQRKEMIDALVEVQSKAASPDPHLHLTVDRATSIHATLEPLCELLMDPRAPNPAGIRYLVNKHIMPIGLDRLPQVELPQDLQEDLEREYQEAKEALAAKAES